MNVSSLQCVVLSVLSISFFLVFVIVPDAALAESKRDVEESIEKTLKLIKPTLQIKTIQKSAVQNLHQVELGDGSIFFATEDGEYFFVGDMFQSVEGRLVNLTEKAKNKTRSEKLNATKKSEIISFVPEGEQKGEIFVFTDVNCGYCRLFHKEYLPKALANGIAINYFAYPIIGGKNSHEQMTTAWCSKDKQSALSTLKDGDAIDEITEKKCKDSPIDAHLALGKSMGISGTPAVFLPNGEKVNVNYLEQTINRHFGILNIPK